MRSKLVLSYYDYSKETSPVGVYGAEIDAANFDAQATLMDNLKAAIEAVTLCTLIKDTRTHSEETYPKTQPTSPYAQREAKWLVSYTDDADPVGDGSFEIPGPDLTLLVAADGQFMNLTAGAGLALKTAIQAFYRSKLENTVTVTTIQHVGRNN